MRLSVASCLLNMRRKLLFFFLERFRHAAAQECRKSDLCLNPCQLLDIFLATVTSECSVHLFESLAAGLGNEEPVEGEGKHEPGGEEDVGAWVD
jgi:hypothetical protein